MSASDNQRRVAFLDRDGTIIIDKHYLRRPEDVELLPGTVEGLRTFRDAGYVLVVVTDQSGVARGYFTEEDVRAVHARLEELLLGHGIRLAAILYCPHHPHGTVAAYALACDCRKPKPGMARQAEALRGPIDYARSWSIGDKPSDVEFGKNLGTKTALIRSEYWTSAPEPPPDLIVNSLMEAAQKIRTMRS